MTCSCHGPGQVHALLALAGSQRCVISFQADAFNRAFTKDRHIPPGRYRTYRRPTQPPTPCACPAQPVPQKGPWRSAAGPAAVHVEGPPSDVAGGVGGQE